MNWSEVLIYLIECIVYLVVIYAIPYAITLLSKKIKNDQNEKYLALAGQVVTDCVLTIKQTFVDDLKANGKFTPDAQREAYEMCKAQVMAILNEKTKEALVMAYGDIEAYIKTAIESSVIITKS